MLQELLNYVIDNKEQLLGVITSVIAACSAIAALTPTPKDDGFVKWCYKIIDTLALNVGKAKDN